MKANELMVGDLVMFCNEPKRVRSIVVSDDNMVERIYVFGKSFQVSTIDDYIQPIPLTPEILVANGFESRELYHFTLYQLGKESFSIAYDLLLKNLCAFTKIFQAGCRLCTIPDKSELSIQIQYVHELQQAMRMIGLRDLANNFVIEKGGEE